MGGRGEPRGDGRGDGRGDVCRDELADDAFGERLEDRLEDATLDGREGVERALRPRTPLERPRSLPALDPARSARRGVAWETLMAGGGEDVTVDGDEVADETAAGMRVGGAVTGLVGV